MDKNLRLLIESTVTGSEHPVHGHVRNAIEKFNQAGNSGRYEAVHDFKCDTSHSHVVETLRHHLTKSGTQDSLHPNEGMSPEPGMAHSTVIHGTGEVPGVFHVDSDEHGNHSIWSRENRD